jgi:hypothetical protein
MTLPNFLIIGAPKAGTSSLYNYLQQHPEIYMSPVKEPHFFSFTDRSLTFTGPGDRERLTGTVTSLADYEQLFAGVTTEKAIGEASTTYLGSPEAAERIKYYLPQVKLIAIVRNPADAAYASFLHLLRDGDESITDFSLALAAEKKRIADNWESLWHYKTRNFYFSQFKRYFDLFEPQQIKIYLYEDFQAKNQAITQDIYQFLEVDSSFIPNLSYRQNVSAMPQNLTLNRLMSKPNPWKSTFNFVVPKVLRTQLKTTIKSWNFNNFKKPEFTSEIRHQLLQEYQEDILKLQDLLDRDLSLWLK